MEKEYFIELDLQKNFDNFDDFLDNSREDIYRSIIKVFKEFLDTNKVRLSLHIRALIQGIDWDTEFNFTNDQFYILTRDILPYFEEQDEYDICIEIRDMLKKRNGEV